MDWSVITPTLACGGAPDTEGVRGLMRHGVTHVIDLRHTTQDFDLYALNFAYLHNPTYDNGDTKDDEWFHRPLRFALGAYGMSPLASVYVGCHQGLHRAPSITYSILRCMHWGRGLSDWEALDLISRARPDAVVRYLGDARRSVDSFQFGPRL